ncbi:MAG TPA: hypothetical protein VKM35_06225 [Arenimonas sp.]|uniref:hypothetical protein n=1 Tax=Arenimonas sp. TaxID=1872635 RepID=UPI002BF21D4F|nr:hypothetical protein [Arenimonas sp.]HMB56788.1 hypothetical protein [Arenimonas sp.]
MFRLLLALIFLGLFSQASFAQSVSVTVGQGIYSGFGPGTLLGEANVMQDVEVRMAAQTNVIGMYRTTNGPSTLPIGTIVTVTYRDGSSEKFIVTGTVGSMQAAPIAGTQKDKNGHPINTCDATCAPAATSGSAGGNEGGGASSSWWNTFWQWLTSYFNQPVRQGHVDIGPIEQ